MRYLVVKIVEASCWGCKHLIRYGICSAFPNGIPEEIKQGKNLHIKPYPGDNEIQFEPQYTKIKDVLK